MRCTIKQSYGINERTNEWTGKRICVSCEVIIQSLIVNVAWASWCVRFCCFAVFFVCVLQNDVIAVFFYTSKRWYHLFRLENTTLSNLNMLIHLIWIFGFLDFRIQIRFLPSMMVLNRNRKLFKFYSMTTERLKNEILEKRKRYEHLWFHTAELNSIAQRICVWNILIETTLRALYALNCMKFKIVDKICWK